LGPTLSYTMVFLDVLPLVVVMVAGPQILTPIFLALSNDWRRNSLGYIAGAAISITLVVTTAYIFGIGAIGQGASNTMLSVVILLVLIFAMIHTYRTRDKAEPPQWMGKLDAATPKTSFRLGFLLLGFFPTDILTSIAVGSYLAANGAPWTYSLPFISLTIFVLSIPFLFLLLFGKRAERALPIVRDWMHTHSWIVNEVVILFFIFLIMGNLLG